MIKIYIIRFTLFWGAESCVNDSGGDWPANMGFEVTSHS